MPLAALKVRHAVPGRHADMHGLYLVVRDAEPRSWMLRIQHRGRRRDFGLGSVSEVSLADAISDMTMMRTIRDKGISGVTAHGFRRSFTDWAA